MEQWECWGHSPGWRYTWSLATELAAQRCTHPLSTDPFYSLRSPPALLCPGICWSSTWTFFLFLLLNEMNTYSALLYSLSLLRKSTENGFWDAFQAIWSTGCGESLPIQAQIWLLGHVHICSLRNESWAASLYYEIKIVPEDHKGRKQNWFQLWLWSLQKSYRGGGAGSVLFLDKWTTKILFYSLPQRQQWDFS